MVVDISQIGAFAIFLLDGYKDIDQLIERGSGCNMRDTKISELAHWMLTYMKRHNLLDTTSRSSWSYREYIKPRNGYYWREVCSSAMFFKEF